MVMPSTPAIGQNVARPRDGFVHALQALERIELRDLRLLNPAVEMADRDFVAMPQRALKHAADGEAAQVIAVIEVGHLGLQDGVGSPAGGGMCFTMASNSGLQILRRVFQRRLRDPGLRDWRRAPGNRAGLRARRDR